MEYSNTCSVTIAVKSRYALRQPPNIKVRPTSFQGGYWLFEPGKWHEWDGDKDLWYSKGTSSLVFARPLVPCKWV